MLFDTCEHLQPVTGNEVPLIVQHQNAWSESFPYVATAPATMNAEAPSGEYTLPSFGHYLRFNRILGGIRLSQQRAAEATCPVQQQGPRWLMKVRKGSWRSRISSN